MRCNTECTICRCTHPYGREYWKDLNRRMHDTRVSLFDYDKRGQTFSPAAGMSVSMILTVNRLLVTKAITCLVRSWATLTRTRPFSKRKHAHSLTWVTPGWRVLLSNGHDRLMFIPRKKRKNTRVIASLLIIVAQQIAVIQVSSDELLSLRWKNL